MTETVSFSETSVIIYQTARYNIREDSHLNIRRRENLKSHKNQDQETNLFNNLISPRRFREGGAAILQDVNKNHHIVILGIKFIKPLLINNLRLYAHKQRINKQSKKQNINSSLPVSRVSSGIDERYRHEIN
jgi:hypothetical protein